MMRMLLAALLAAPLAAAAQYSGPAVEACRTLAQQESARDAATRVRVQFDADQSLIIERHARKLGSQFVASILTGNGAVVYDGAPSAELAFICLLADERRAVFFQWLANPYARPLDQCTRHEALRKNPLPCLEALLQAADLSMVQVSALRFQEAREKDVAAGNESYSNAFRKAAEEWRGYRDAECARRRDYAPKGVEPAEVHLACMIELTRRRRLDLR
jgi:uncharacterized protein YecT (DUF1311 family)